MKSSLDKSVSVHCFTLSTSWWVGSTAFTVSSDLYAGLAGESGVAATISTLIDRIAFTPQEARSFKAIDLPGIKARSLS